MGEMCTKEYRTGYTRYVEPVNTHPLQSTSPISVVPFHNGHTVDECSRADGVRNEISLQESQDDDVQLINNFNAFLCRSQKEITRNHLIEIIPNHLNRSHRISPGER